MGIRRTINRHRTEPYGDDYHDVLRRGKAFYRASGVFEMIPFTHSDGRTFWLAYSESLPNNSKFNGTRTFKFDTSHKRWIEVK